VYIKGLPEYCKSPQINLIPGQKLRPRGTLSQNSWPKIFQNNCSALVATSLPNSVCTIFCSKCAYRLYRCLYCRLLLLLSVLLTCSILL